MRTLRLAVASLLVCCLPLHAAERWSPAKANAWYNQQPWLVGCNFIPSTAINELEMWQADTFDPATIDRELGWAHDIGFNTVRVFLHNIPWEQNRAGFLERVDKFLQIADRHQIRVTFVLFDSVWNARPQAGPQPAPTPHVHNSGWVQAPGAAELRDPAAQPRLHGYVKDVVGRYAHDKRVLMWDLMNEPDNRNESQDPPEKVALATALLKNTFAWVREINPDQPLTTGVWDGEWANDAKLKPMERLQLNNSDVITFHNYRKVEEMKADVQALRRFGRPVICTEYMARTRGSTFETILPYLGEARVGAYNWGFVSGKTQTIYPWDSWHKKYTAEPEMWFHDVLHADGKPYDAKETKLIRDLVDAQAKARATTAPGQ